MYCLNCLFGLFLRFCCLIPLTIALGSAATSPIILSWVPYTVSGQMSDVHWFFKGVAWYIVIYPAFDVVSVFPMVCVSTIDTVMDDVSLTQWHRRLTNYLIDRWQMDQHSINDAAKVDKFLCKFARVIYVVISCGLALWSDDFQQVLTLSGVMVVIDLGLLPAMVELNSQYVIKQVCIDMTDISELREFHWTSHKSVVYLDMVLCCIISIGTVISFFQA